MAARVEYATGTVYGNNAYDLSRIGGYAFPKEEEYEQPSPEELARERVRERLRERELARERAKARENAQTFGVPVLGILGALVVAVLMVFVLFGYVHLAELSAERTQLTNSIAELNEQNDKLKIEYEMAFNLADVEAYAVNILGMVKMDADDITILGTELEDKAEILADDDTSSGFLGMIEDFVGSIVEYFS